MMKLKSFTILFLSMFVLGIALAAVTPLETKASKAPLPVRTDCAVYPQCVEYEGSLATILITGVGSEEDTTFQNCGCME